MAAAADTGAQARAHLEARSRWRWTETVFWLAALAPFVLAPSYLSLASQIAIAALFALSLDLILGYAGIVSLGHAAFFGIGAYAAGLMAKSGWGEPLSGLLAALLLGIADVAGKYYVPKLGAFIVYTLMIVILMLRPQGLFARAGSGK